METRNNKLFDALLKVAAEESVISELEALPSDDELAEMYPRSDILDARVKKIIARSDSGRRRMRAIRTFARAAASLAILIVVGSAVLFSVEGSRIFILNTIIDIRNDYTVIEFESLAPAGIARFHFDMPRVLPDGFEYIESEYLNSMSITVYAAPGGEQVLLTEFFGEGMTMHIGRLDREFSIQEIDGREVYIFEATGYEADMNIILWTEGYNVLQIMSAIDIEELLAVVVSIKQ